MQYLNLLMSHSISLASDYRLKFVLQLYRFDSAISYTSKIISIIFLNRQGSLNAQYIWSRENIFAHNYYILLFLND
jgi:hypothetical protein